MIAIATVAFVVLLGVYFWILTPLLDRKDSLNAQITKASQDLKDADYVFATQKRKNLHWATLSATAVKREAPEAESQVLNSLLEWSRDAGLTLSSLKPERTEKEKDFQKVTFRATGQGSMSQVSRFLHRIQTATIPIRVTDLAISTHKEATDDLLLQLGVSTIYPVAADPDKARTASAAWEAPR